jgi:hypothetical protein
MKILDWAGGLFRWVAGAVAPMFVRPVAPVPLAWFAHGLLVLLLVIGAWVLHNRTGWITLRPDVGRFTPYWLPTVVLLVYLLLWAAAVLRDLLAPVQPTEEFPDLDAAWAGVLSALENQGIPLRDTPLYLVLGELPAGFDPLFRAMPHGLSVSGGNPSGASLQVFANRDAIYLTVPGATLLGAQAASAVIELVGVSPTESLNLMASIGIGGSIGLAGFGSLMAGSLAVGESMARGGRSIAGSIGGSIGMGGQFQEIQQIIQKAREQGRPLTAQEKERMKELSDHSRPKSRRTPTKTAPRGNEPANVLQNPPLIAEAEARMNYLCELVSSARWPASPVNGAILAVPITALDQDSSAQQWGLVARHDLNMLERYLRLHFPVFAVVGGVETLPGGGAFFDKFASDKTHRRLGKGFPLNPDVRLDQIGPAVEQVAEYVLAQLLPNAAMKLTRVTGHLASDTADNADLIRFSDAVRRRASHLGRLLSRAITGTSGKPVFGGCYLSVNLPSNPGEAVFVKELFDKVVGTSKCVAWTPDAYARDSAYRRATLLGNLALVALIILVVGLACYVGYKQFGR